MTKVTHEKRSLMASEKRVGPWSTDDGLIVSQELFPRAPSTFHSVSSIRMRRKISYKIYCGAAGKNFTYAILNKMSVISFLQPSLVGPHKKKMTNIAKDIDTSYSYRRDTQPYKNFAFLTEDHCTFC